MADTADLAVRLTLDDRFSRQLGRAQSNLGKFSTGVSKAGRGAGQLATGIVKAGAAIGAIAGVGLVGVAKAAIDFEDAFAGVRKTVNETDLTAAGLSFETLRQSFLDMSTTIPVAASDLAKIGETAGALGIKAQDIDDFTQVVAKLGVTTNLTTDAAADALGRIGTILGLSGKQFDDFADVLVNLGNQGASTESDIIETTKRFAAMGRQAGLATPQILALASAATSLGAEPEAAGSALSRIFGNMSREIANGSAKGKTFAKVTGKSITELRRMVNKGQGLPILLETLKGISKMSRTEAASTLKALGINNVRDINAILLMSQNLGFVNDQLEIASHSTGALGKEASTRFATTASKIALLKNNLTAAAITIGTEFLPALGRAADKLIALLKAPGTAGDLKKLGQDIGAAIDSINWTEVVNGGRQFVEVLRTSAAIALQVVGALNKLPTEVKALGLGLAGLNKLSGGLVFKGLGGIFEGAGESLARSFLSNIPGIGKAFVQPVFVTNPGFGVGGGGGGLPAAGGKVAGGVGLLAGGAAVAAGTAIGAGIIVAGDLASQAIDKAGHDAAVEIGLSNRDPRRFGPNGIPRSPVDILNERNRAAAARRGPTTAAAAGAAVANIRQLDTRPELIGIRNAVIAQTAQENARLAYLQTSTNYQTATMRAGDTRSELAIGRLALTTQTQQAATRQTILAGDTRSEAAIGRLSAKTGTVAAGVAGVRGAVGAIPGAIARNRPIVNVSVVTRVSVRDGSRTATHAEQYGKVHAGKP